MVALTLQDIQFMLMVLAPPDYLRNALERLRVEQNKSISDEMADELRDLCTDRLDTHGFDADYNPNEEGKKLGDLIDKLYVG